MSRKTGEVTMQKKITIITTVHPLKDPRIFYKQAISLKKAGYAVTHIVQCETEQERDLEGIRIVPLRRPKNRLARFFQTNWQAYFQTNWQAYKKARATGEAVYHFHDPEFIPFGLLLKRSGARVIYDVHEDLPLQIKDKGWIAKPLRNTIAAIINVLEKNAARYFDAVVTATDHIAGHFKKANKMVIVIYNYPLHEELFNGRSERSLAGHSNNFIYLGDLSAERGLMVMVEALNLLPEKYEAKLFLGGKFGSKEDKEAAEKLTGWGKVQYRGWLERDEVAAALGEVKAGLVILQPKERFFQSLPLKMFEYMAAGIPVIASDFPYWCSIIEKEKCGIAIDPENPEAVAGAMSFIIDNPAEAEAMGARGRAAVEIEYNWMREERKLLAIYETLLAD